MGLNVVMTNIIVTEKPHEISWEDLAELQHQAHVGNIAKGVRMLIASCTAETLQRDLEDGITFVAQNDKSQLIGMISVCFRKVRRWWHHGDGAYLCCLAVSPDYQNCGVYKALNNRVEDIIREKGIEVAYLNTHIGNKIARQAYEKKGYRNVRFSPGGGPGYYSVEMAKWFGGREKSAILCKIMYLASEIVVRVLFKPGKVRRF